MTGYLICRVCGKRIPQNTYDCDIPIVCADCDTGGNILDAIDRYDKSTIGQAVDVDTGEVIHGTWDTIGQLLREGHRYRMRRVPKPGS